MRAFFSRSWQTEEPGDRRLPGCHPKQQHQHAVQSHAGGDGIFLGEGRAGDGAPGRCVSLKIRACFLWIARTRRTQGAE